MNNIYPILKDTNGTDIYPYLWLKYDTGALLVDSSPNNITLNNGGSVVNSSSVGSGFVKGNNSAYFPLAGEGYLGSGSGVVINGYSFSVAMWIYTVKTGGVIISIGNYGSNGACVYFYLKGDYKYEYSITTYNIGLTTNTYSSDINNWVHIVLTYNHSTRLQEIYRNGVKITMGVSTASGQPNTSGAITIGALGGVGMLWKGYMDDLRIYRGQVLTQDQVLTLYKPVVYTKNIYGQDVIEEKKLDYELIKYPSRFPDTIGAIDATNKEQTFTINNSDYKVKFSSYSDDYKEATPLYLFDGNTNNQNKNENMGGYFGNKTENKYNQTIGTYNGTSSFEGTKGEWVSITFQTSFILKKYGFIAKADREANAPGSWVLYAKTTGNTYQSIDTSSATLTERDYNNVNTLYNKLILDNTVESNTYVFVFTGLTNTTNNNYEDNNLNFIEILLFGIINE